MIATKPFGVVRFAGGAVTVTGVHISRSGRGAGGGGGGGAANRPETRGSVGGVGPNAGGAHGGGGGAAGPAADPPTTFTLAPPRSSAAPQCLHASPSPKSR